jgi:hypothetical protein
MCPILLSEPEQPGDECSRPFGPFGSPQLNVELKHGSEIVVEREPPFLKQSNSVPVLSNRQLSFEAAGLISMEFPLAKPPQYRCRKKRSPESNWMVVNKLNAIARLSIDVIKLAVSEERHECRTARAEVAHLD